MTSYGAIPSWMSDTSRSKKSSVLVNNDPNSSTTSHPLVQHNDAQQFDWSLVDPDPKPIPPGGPDPYDDPSCRPLVQFKGWFPYYEATKETSTLKSHLSKSKLKKIEYNNKSYEVKRFFERSGLTRPQFVYKDFARRARQINLKFVDFSYHPLADKIRDWIPSSDILKCRMDWEIYPFSNGKPKPSWVTDPEQLDTLVECLEQCTEFAFDLESHGFDSREGFVALLQIATYSYGDFLVDCVKLQGHIERNHKFKQVLESTDILKIMHGIPNDVTNMQKSFDIFLAGVIDLEVLYHVVNGGNPISCKNMSKAFHPKHSADLDNEETLSDWRLRPGKGLTSSQEAYATHDVHFLLRIFDRMKSILIEKGDEGSEKLLQAFQETKTRCLKWYRSKVLLRTDFTDMAHHAIVALNNDRRSSDKVQNLSPAQHKLFGNLIEWRHNLGQVIDRNDSDILPNYRLLDLAVEQPSSIERVASVLGYHGRELEKTSMQNKILVQIITKGDPYMIHLRTLECYNCLQTGHGPAVFCPKGLNNENRKIFYDRPENLDKKRAIAKKRRQNYAANLVKKRYQTVLTAAVSSNKN